ncbi:MAG: Stp1/IreP family PP2C-type Ser/Thr phosphatase [Deltaproteobacteria bacterium]|nr:MAG: Stp1/IreP family PP2C-type Ser/Thr phosphatase [Deltaproteobacteria bacterium]
MKLQVCAKTDIGLSRNNNEDRYFVDKQRGLFIVADGMGGHTAGEVASQIAVETICHVLHTVDKTNPQQQLKQAVTEANLAVRQAAKVNPSLHGMGTTLSIILLHQQQGYLAHVGDSRIYRLHNQKLQQLSDDHSLVGEQLRQGTITPEQAKSSSLGNILLQAIGLSPQLDIYQDKISLAPADQFLLCSDGLTDLVSDTEIEKHLRQTGTIDLRCDALINAALAAGGKDNITAILLQIEQLDEE